MPVDPQWFANDVAVAAAAISGIALGVAGMSAWYARRQAQAGERQAGAGEESVRLQAEALKSSAEDTARALQIAQESSDAAKSSAAALQAQAECTREALETAQRSAEAAERLAEANEALAIAGQRGWLIVFKADGAAQHAPEHSKVNVRAGFVFRNVGKTPIANIYLRHCEKVLPDDPRDYVGLRLERHATLAPAAEIELSSLCECSSAEFSKIKRRELKVYFWGNATYEDIFGHSHGITWQWEFDGDNLVVSEKGNAFKASHE
jgi:hypothetical protein